MSDDKRTSPRVSNVAELECHTADGTAVSARMSDLSTTGAFLDSMNSLPPGTKLSMRFAAGQQEIRVTAEVVHTMPNFGMGVRFLDLPGEARAAIEALVREQG
jgi:c-di-GMP-binding flagellar brake protein YcgR